MVGVVLVVEGWDLVVAGAAVERDGLRQDVVRVEPHQPRGVLAGVPFRTPGSTNVLHVVRIVGDELKGHHSQV